MKKENSPDQFGSTIRASACGLRETAGSILGQGHAPDVGSPPWLEHVLEN